MLAAAVDQVTTQQPQVLGVMVAVVMAVILIVQQLASLALPTVVVVVVAQEFQLQAEAVDLVL